MKRALRWIVFLPVALLLILVSIANRHSVVFSLDPFRSSEPAVALNVPLFWLLFAALAIGVVVGGIATWFTQGKWRKAARHEHAELVRTRREVERGVPVGPALPPPLDRRPAA